MNGEQVTFSVFTKPWKTLSLGELGALVRGFGFDAVELPVRPGYQVQPDTMETGLKEAVRAFADEGIVVKSVAAPTDGVRPGFIGELIAACAENDIPVIRVFPFIRPDEPYLEGEARVQNELESFLPLLEQCRVTVGVQNHCGPCFTGAMHLRHLIERFDPQHIGAILDAGHTGLSGEEPEHAIDMVWSHLCMVNFKNAFRRLRTGPEAEQAEWQVYWTSARHGLSDWRRYAAELKKRRWRGTACLTAEYSDPNAVDRLIADDLRYTKSLFV